MTTQRRGGQLEDVIGEVAASYAAGRLIDSLGSAQLPNKRLVIEALNHLKSTMYLGYYSTRSVDDARLRAAVGSHLYPAYDILVEQIGRAANYEGFRTAGRAARPDVARDRRPEPAPQDPGDPRAPIEGHPSPPSRAIQPRTASRR